MDAPPPAQPASSLAASTGVTPFAQSAFPSAAGFPSSPIPVVTAAQEVIYAQQQAAMDWATSFHGISSAPFSEKAVETLMRPLTPAEIEIKPGELARFDVRGSGSALTILHSYAVASPL